MTPIHYTAEILPDGHLPLPQGFPGRAGEKVSVTLSPADVRTAADSAGTDPAGYFLEHWAGTGHGSGEPIAERHDEYLYDR